MFLILVAAAVAGLSFYFYYYEPALAKAKVIDTEIGKLEKEIEDLKRIDQDIMNEKKRIEEKEKRKRELETESTRLETIVPKLLDSIELISNKFDVRFQDIRISPLVKAEQWSELPVELSISGTFDKIGGFLRVVEQRKIINLANRGSLNISVSAEPDPKTKHPLLNVTLNGRVFIMGGGF